MRRQQSNNLKQSSISPNSSKKIINRKGGCQNGAQNNGTLQNSNNRPNGIVASLSAGRIKRAMPNDKATNGNERSISRQKNQFLMSSTMLQQNMRQADNQITQNAPIVNNHQDLLEIDDFQSNQMGLGLLNASPIKQSNCLNIQSSHKRANLESQNQEFDINEHSLGQFINSQNCQIISQHPLLLKAQKTPCQSGNIVSLCNGTVQQNLSGKCPNSFSCITGSAMSGGIQSIILSNSQTNQKYEVYMRCVTWSRDSHGLFDYESKNIAKKNIKTQTGGKILRVNDDVEFVSIRTQPEEVDPNAKPMIIVKQINGQFQIQNDTIVAVTPRDSEGNPIPDEDVNNKMFVVVRNTKSAQNNLHYKLGRGDIVKLGRIKFNIKDYRKKFIQNSTSNKIEASDLLIQQNANNLLIENAEIIDGDEVDQQRLQAARNLRSEITPQKQLLHNNSNDSLKEEFEEEAVEIDCGVVDLTKNPDIQCKVCWDNTSTQENPLLNSCQCDGSVRYIHYDCLKYWLKQKMAKKEEKNLISYTWKQFECEICKKPYPYVFRSNGVSYRLIDVEPDIPVDRNFLLLESLTFEKNSSRMVHLIMPDIEKKIFKLGRGHESDIRVSDISVSRCHALIKYSEENGQFYLEDNLSKFGTLVLAKGSIDLEPEMTKAVQIGRSVISFTVKPYIQQVKPQIQGSFQQQHLIQSSQQNGRQNEQYNQQCSKFQMGQNEGSAYKTPSPQRNQQVVSNNLIAQQIQQKSQVEEILRQRIEETNLKINQLMQTALAHQQLNNQQQLNVRSQQFSADSAKNQSDSVEMVLNLYQQKTANQLKQQCQQKDIPNNISQFNNNLVQQQILQIQQLKNQKNTVSDNASILDNSIDLDLQKNKNQVISNAQDSDQNDRDDHLSQINLDEIGNNINLQHLLRATNHLKIAQNEFELAQKYLQNNFGRFSQQSSSQKPADLNQDHLKLQNKNVSAPNHCSDYQQQNRQNSFRNQSNDIIIGWQQLMNNNDLQYRQNSGNFSMQNQNGQKNISQNQGTGDSSHKKNQEVRYLGNFSEQKTPTNDHLSFLYRANINLNDLNKEALQAHQGNSFGHLNNMILEEQYLQQQLQNQNNKLQQMNISSFYNDDANDFEENKEQSIPHQSNFGDLPLRLPFTSGHTKAIGVSSPRNKESIENFNEPVSQMIQIHQLMSGQKQQNNYKYNSNSQGVHQLNNNGEVYSKNIYSDQSQKMQLMSDEMLAAQAQLNEIREFSKDQSRGKSVSEIMQNQQISIQLHQKFSGQPQIKKNPSSPSKVFKQYNPQQSQSYQSSFCQQNQESNLINMNQLERSPFRGSSEIQLENRRGCTTTTAGGTDNRDQSIGSSNSSNIKGSFGNAYSGIAQRKQQAQNAGQSNYFHNGVIDYGNGALKNEAKEYNAQINAGILMEEGCGNSIQNVQQRLKEYQGSHGKSNVSKALFQAQNSMQLNSSTTQFQGMQQQCEQINLKAQNSASKLQSKTASAFQQNLRF